MTTVKSFGLSVSEREDLALFVDHPAWAAAMKLLGALKEEEEQKVLTYALDRGADGLVHEKARSEGAQRLAHNFESCARAIAKKEFSRK